MVYCDIANRFACIPNFDYHFLHLDILSYQLNVDLCCLVGNYYLGLSTPVLSIRTCLISISIVGQFISKSIFHCFLACSPLFESQHLHIIALENQLKC